MNGLLRKDFLFIAKKYKVSLLFLLIAALPALEKERVDLIFGVYLFAIMLSIQSDLVTASKEKSWKKVEESLPVSPLGIVLEKYIAALLFLLAGSIVFLLFSVLEKNMAGKSVWEALPTFIFLMVSCCVALSLQIPVLYRFGKRVGVAVFLLLAAIACIVIVGIRWWGWGDSAALSVLFRAPVSILLMAGAVVLTVLSWLLSTHIYRNQDR